MSTGDKPKLYIAWYCPYAARARIAFLQKGVDFEYIEIDPFDKSPEWLAINPLGQAPAIVHHDKNIYQSVVCVEYVEEAWPDTDISLMPKDLHERAMARIWAHHIDSNITPNGYRILLKPTQKEQDAEKVTMLKHVLSLCNAMADPKDGPFFMGKTFGFVDALFAPFAHNYSIVHKNLRDFEIPNEGGFERFHIWWKAVKEVESVKESTRDQTPEKLLNLYTEFLVKFGPGK